MALISQVDVNDTLYDIGANQNSEGKALATEEYVDSKASGQIILREW